VKQTFFHDMPDGFFSPISEDYAGLILLNANKK